MFKIIYIVHAPRCTQFTKYYISLSFMLSPPTLSLSLYLFFPFIFSLPLLHPLTPNTTQCTCIKSLYVLPPEFGSSWVCGRGRLRMGAVVKYVTEHSVGVGQVGPPSEKILSSLLVVPHQGIIIVAAR